MPFGSGLNTLSTLPYLAFRRIKWASCSDASGSDCLTPKGFTFMRVALSTSADNTTTAYADFYNLHADAGTEAGDLTARQANIAQVAAYIAQWSTGNAVVVYGDTNSRYTRAGDTAVRGLLSAGLADPWVELRRGGVLPAVEDVCGNPADADSTCEGVDKVFYRGSALVGLRAEAFRYDGGRFLQADGSVLSDHNPVFVQFAWEAGAGLRQSAFSGGEEEGAWFSDVSVLAGVVKPRVATLTFRGGARLDSVGVTLTDGTKLRHGGTGGTEVALQLGSAEYWTEARLCRGDKSGKTRNFYIQAATSAGRTLTAGTATADCATFAAPDGWQIVGFVGQDGDEMDQLAFVYAPR